MVNRGETKKALKIISYFPDETALFWVITQRVVVINYRRFGTTYRSHLLGVFVFLIS
jgi:hypothetical protein